MLAGRQVAESAGDDRRARPRRAAGRRRRRPRRRDARLRAARRGALVDALREAGKATISLVAEREGRVVGHVLFSPGDARSTPTRRSRPVSRRSRCCPKRRVEASAARSYAPGSRAAGPPVTRSSSCSAAPPTTVASASSPPSATSSLRVRGAARRLPGDRARPGRARGSCRARALRDQSSPDSERRQPRGIASHELDDARRERVEMPAEEMIGARDRGERARRREALAHGLQRRERAELIAIAGHERERQRGSPRGSRARSCGPAARSRRCPVVASGSAQPARSAMTEPNE